MCHDGAMLCSAAHQHDHKWSSGIGMHLRVINQPFAMLCLTQGLHSSLDVPVPQAHVQHAQQITFAQTGVGIIQAKPACPGIRASAPCP